MEIYLTIDEYMDTIFGFLSALGSLAGGGAAIWAILLAKGYLDEHREKLKEENRQKIIIICIQLVSKLRLEYNNLYTFNFDETTNISDDNELSDFLSRRLNSYHQKRKSQPNVAEEEIQLHSYLSVLNDKDLLEFYKLQLTFSRKIQKYIQEIIDLASENDFWNSYQKMKFLSNIQMDEGRLKSLDLLYNALQSMRDKLLELYHYSETKQL